MNDNGLGPYAGIQLLTVARGVAAVQQYLRRGWTLISSQFCEELIEGGTGTRRQIRKHELYSVFGRGFIKDEAAPDAQEEARVVATEEGEDSLADGQSVRLAPADDGEDDETEPALAATALRVPTGAEADAQADQEQHPAQRPRVTRRGSPAAREAGYKPIHTGTPGTTEATGLPNARR